MIYWGFKTQQLTVKAPIRCILVIYDKNLCIISITDIQMNYMLKRKTKKEKKN